MPELSAFQWVLAAVGAFSLGVGKAGLGGLSLLHVLIFAFLFGARSSTGIVLPMLLVGDVCAVRAFHQHARWDYIRKMLPPACLGVIVCAALMRHLSDAMFRPVIGWIILALAVMQFGRMQRPEWFGDVPHSRGFAWSLGLLAGGTTMLANAAGPIIAIYSLSVGLPKVEFVATGAWLFFILNAFKVPFSIALGLIHGESLQLNVVLVPAVVAGVVAGRWITQQVPQRLFERLLLAFAVLAALRLIA